MDTELRELIETATGELKKDIRRAILIYVLFWVIPALVIAVSYVALVVGVWRLL